MPHCIGAHNEEHQSLPRRCQNVLPATMLGQCTQRKDRGLLGTGGRNYQHSYTSTGVLQQLVNERLVRLELHCIWFSLPIQNVSQGKERLQRVVTRIKARLVAGGHLQNREELHDNSSPTRISISLNPLQSFFSLRNILDGMTIVSTAFQRIGFHTPFSNI
jgi:hypothetical protein